MQSCNRIRRLERRACTWQTTRTGGSISPRSMHGLSCPWQRSTCRRSSLAADRLRQVLWNLLSNAIKFTPAGGSVRAEALRDGNAVVVTGKGIGRVPAVRLRYVSPGGCVQDTPPRRAGARPSDRAPRRPGTRRFGSRTECRGRAGHDLHPSPCRCRRTSAPRPRRRLWISASRSSPSSESCSSSTTETRADSLLGRSATLGWRHR